MILVRYFANKLLTKSVLVVGDTKFDILEKNFDGAPKLPDGVYSFIPGTNSKGKDVVKIFNDQFPVSLGFQLHVANSTKDLNGCLGIGEASPGDKDWVANSKINLDLLLSMLKTGAYGTKVEFVSRNLEYPYV